MQQQTDEVFKDSQKKQEQIEAVSQDAKKNAEAAIRSERKAKELQA